MQTHAYPPPPPRNPRDRTEPFSRHCYGSIQLLSDIAPQHQWLFLREQDMVSLCSFRGRYTRSSEKTGRDGTRREQISRKRTRKGGIGRDFPSRHLFGDGKRFTPISVFCFWPQASGPVRSSCYFCDEKTLPSRPLPFQPAGIPIPKSRDKPS